MRVQMEKNAVALFPVGMTERKGLRSEWRSYRRSLGRGHTSGAVWVGESVDHVYGAGARVEGQELPTYVHQFLLGQIFTDMMSFYRIGGFGYLPFMGPLGVQLNDEDSTVLRPDLVLIGDRQKLRDGVIYGAPELVMDILPPYFGHREWIIDFNKYMQAGVREYWVLDPEKEIVIVYCFDPIRPTAIYSFEDEIPVRISGGQLTIDMGDISSLMHHLLPRE